MSIIIGLDAKRAFHNRTGLGNYSRTIITSMARLYPEFYFVLFTPRFKHKPLFPEANNWSNIKVVTPPKLIPSVLWRTFLLEKEIKKYHCNLYHGLSGELPKNSLNIPQTVTIHDLIFIRFPEYYKKIDREIYFNKTKYACLKADIIQVNTLQTKNDLIKYMNIAPDKIKVVYHTCNERFDMAYSNEALVNVKRKYGLPDRFILNVGTLEERKNSKLILKALLQLPDSIHLVLVGKETEYTAHLIDFIKKKDLEKRVKILRNIANDDLPLIYRNAEIFVYPSRFEGFGLPVLEATKSKIPVIAAKGSCLEEVGGPSCIYIHPDDENALARGVEKILNNAEYRNVMVASAYDYSKQFSEAQIATQTMEIYLQLLGK